MGFVASSGHHLISSEEGHEPALPCNSFGETSIAERKRVSPPLVMPAIRVVVDYSDFEKVKRNR